MTAHAPHPHRDATYERWRWQVFGITWLAYAGFYLTRKSIAAATIPLTDDVGIRLSESDISRIDMAYLIAYALGQILWGISGDKVGTRRVVLLGMFASALTGCMAALAVHPQIAENSARLAQLLGICMLLQGIWQSCGWAPLTKNVSNFFAVHERGVVLGLWASNYAVGAAVAQTFAGYMAKHYGVSATFYGPALVLAGIATLFFLLQRNRPEDVGLAPVEEYRGEKLTVLEEGERPEEEPEGSWKVTREVLTNPMVLLLAFVYFFVKPTRYAIFLWGPKYLNDKLGTGVYESSFLSSAFDIAGPVSVLLGGLVSDWLFRSKRVPVIVLSLLSLSVLLFFMDYLPPSKYWLATCFFCIGLLLYAPDAMISATAAVDFGTRKGASTAAGLINCLGSIGAVLGGGAPGLLREKLGFDWGGVFNVLALSVLIAGLLMLPRWNAVPATAPDNNNEQS